MTESAIQAELLPLPCQAELQSSWCALETRAAANFFLSWTWIGRWLDWLKSHRTGTAHDLRLLRAFDAQGTVRGLAIVCQGRSQRRLWPFGSAWFVHQTGDCDADSLTIEYNGFLLDRDRSMQAADAMWQCLLARSSSPREFHLRMAAADHHPPPPLLPNLQCERTPVDTWEVDLAEVRRRDHDYLSLLSPSRRTKIRRTLRTLSDWGPVQVTAASSIAQAHEYLRALTALHVRRWPQSYFARPAQQAFHAHLIEDAFPQGRAQLLRIHAGPHDIGYLYNFISGPRVLFYQSGYDYELLDERHVPGLVTLSEAVNFNARQGHDWFDFLAGDNHYKGSLGTPRQALYTVTYQPRHWHWALERTLRRWAQDVRQIRHEKALGLVGRMLAIGALAVSPWLGEIQLESQIFDVRRELRETEDESDFEDDRQKV